MTSVLTASTLTLEQLFHGRLDLGLGASGDLEGDLVVLATSVAFSVITGFTMIS